MLTAHFDCFAGASGDMILASLLDAGLSQEALVNELNKLNLAGWHIDVEKVNKRGIAAANVQIKIVELAPPHRHLQDILNIIETSNLKPKVKALASEIFNKLAVAEAKVHGISPDKVHFHEVGALDSIIDIVGVCIGLDLLQIQQISCSKLPLGWGTVTCQHGLLPVPTPATLELIKGLPTIPGYAEGELLTPTGAAILATLSNHFGSPPSMTIEGTGYGAGTKDLPIANVLRVLLGRNHSSVDTLGLLKDEVDCIECNIDDLNPEIYQYLMDKLLAQGALDVFITPIIMKKSRPANLLRVLAPIDMTQELARIILTETSTIGVRTQRYSRLKAQRKIIQVHIEAKPIRVKYSWVGDEGLNPIHLAPEYEDCSLVAQATGISLKEIYRQAEAKALATLKAEKETVSS